MIFHILITLADKSVYLAEPTVGGGRKYWLAGSVEEFQEANGDGSPHLQGKIEIQLPAQYTGDGPWVAPMIPVALDTASIEEAADLLYDLIHESKTSDLIRAHVALQMKIAQMNEVASALQQKAAEGQS